MSVLSITHEVPAPDMLHCVQMHRKTDLATGRILLAHPLEPSWFERAAVLLCSHSPLHGSYGLAINVTLPFSMRRSLPNSLPEAAAPVSPFADCMSPRMETDVPLWNCTMCWPGHAGHAGHAVINHQLARSRWDICMCLWAHKHQHRACQHWDRRAVLP